MSRFDFLQDKKIWKDFFQMSAWVAAIIGAFLTAPSQLSINQSTSPAIAFLQFIATIAFGFAFSFRDKIRPRSARKIRSIALIIAVTVLTLLFFIYFFLKPHWTCDFAQRFTLVIGNKYTSDANEFIIKNPEFGTASCDKLLAEYAGNNFKIWEGDVIFTRFVILTLLFSFAWLTAVATIILFVEQIASLRDARKRANQSARPE